MRDSFYLAWRYLLWNRSRSLTLVACVTLVAVLPLALELLLTASERQLSSRAQTTPLMLGARGSALDLVMNGLYFDSEVPELISMAAVDELDQARLAIPIPLYVRFKARGFPIVGTTLDYFDFRGLEIAHGRSLALLGECVIGSGVAQRLGLAPGDHLLSSPETLFDLAGVYPLRMKVVGVLSPTQSPDDRAVFVDLKTAWVVQGLVHGHKGIDSDTDAGLIIEDADDNLVVSAKLVEYTEITEDNIDSFHFHGDAASYPISGVITLPDDQRAGTILRGRYLEGTGNYQLVVPAKVIDGLLENIFRIKNVLDAVILVVGIATVMALVLVFSLSIRLRQSEIRTVYRIGGSRGTIVRLVLAEIVIVLSASAVLIAIMLMALYAFSDELVRLLFIR